MGMGSPEATALRSPVRPGGHAGTTSAHPRPGRQVAVWGRGTRTPHRLAGAGRTGWRAGGVGTGQRGGRRT